MIQIQGLYEATRSCTACTLREGCQGPVPAKAGGRVMLVGEAPGRNEDETGVPFTGQAGEYLNSLLETAGLNRGEVTISNTVKCRPKSKCGAYPRDTHRERRQDYTPGLSPCRWLL
mgnify:CR=1 FL=1